MIVEDGKISALGQGDVPEFSGARLEFPDAVVLPAFVNAHTHLACHFLKNGDRDLDFSSWLQSGVAPRVIDAAKNHPELLRKGAERAVEELLGGGVGTVADSFFHPAGRDALCSTGLRGVFFREQFGSMSTNLDDYSRGACEQIDKDAAAKQAHLRVLPGVAPHAPYTCPPQVLQAVVERARFAGLRSSIHLAESPAESDFFERSRGPLFEAFAAGRCKARYQFGASPVATLEALGVLGPDVLAVHAVHLSAADIQILAKTDTPVVHCPSSNLALSVGVSPLLELREAGVLCALGTDSGASVGKLDMFEEMRLAILAQRGRPERPKLKFGARDVLEMATLNGAKALGLDATGALKVGMHADFSIVDLARAKSQDFDDPEEAIVWAGTPDDVKALVIAGEFLFGEPQS